MGKYDHGHAIFADGQEVEFGFSGWPVDLLPESDTKETLPERARKRLEYIEQAARDWAGPGYETKDIVRLWLAG